jgi:YebC/PmpR family DNA-binding regulatory protein
MSGHNRWSKIKRKKEAQGAAKGKLFTRLIHEITIAARAGGGDPAGNPRLRAAMDEAKSANMPAENVARAVKKGLGELEGAHVEEVVYEGYGPGGAPVLVECLTDNRKRTATAVRTAFSKGGGALGAEGSVIWKFERVGTIEVRPGPTEDAVVEAAIEAGAEEVVSHGADGFEVRTHPGDLHAVGGALERRLPLGARRLAFLPKDPPRLEDAAKARQLLELLAALDDLEDVQEIHASFELAGAAAEVGA